jgi:hypothetical protein
MADTPLEAQIHQLEEELSREKERADRAEIEAHVAWDAMAIMRELLVKHGFNITMTRDYEPIKALEGCGLHDEVERRLTDKRIREMARAIIVEGEKLASHPPPEAIEEEDDEAKDV